MIRCTDSSGDGTVGEGNGVKVLQKQTFELDHFITLQTCLRHKELYSVEHLTHSLNSKGLYKSKVKRDTHVYEGIRPLSPN